MTTKLHGKVQRQLLVKQHAHRPRRIGMRGPARLHLIRRAWTETRPFGWLGRYYQYRPISIWPPGEAAAPAPLERRVKSIYDIEK